MKLSFTGIAVAMFAAIALSAASADEFYKWVDENGETHFADSPAQIPAKYRKQTETKEFSKYRPSSSVVNESERPKVEERRTSAPQDRSKSKPSASPTVAQLGDADFEKEALGGNSLVYFWAPWCGVCKRTTPNLNEAAAELGGKVKVFALNTDEAEKISNKYSIKYLPTFILFKSGEEAERETGGLSKERIIAMAKKGEK